MKPSMIFFANERQLLIEKFSEKMSCLYKLTQSIVVDIIEEEVFRIPRD